MFASSNENYFALFLVFFFVFPLNSGFHHQSQKDLSSACCWKLSWVQTVKTMFLCISMHAKRHSCQTFFSRLGVQVQFVDPVIASGLDIESLQNEGIVSKAWCPRIPIPRPQSFFRFEVACAMSHVRAAQMIVDSNVPWAFVFEDDNVIDEKCIPKFHKICEWAQLHHNVFNVINISPCNSLHFPTRPALYPNTQGCTNALLYSRNGAKHLLSKIYPLSSPIDDWLHVNMPSSYCMHDRICRQEDADAPITWTTFWNPILRKKEYAMSLHLLSVWVCVPAVLVSLFLLT